MLCACSGEQYKFDEPEPEPQQSPESLATRDFSASGISSRTGTVDWDSKFEDAQVDEAESTLKEALSLNYEEARALLGRLEYQRGNFDAALQVFQGIDIKSLSSRMSKAISERLRPRKSRSKGETALAGVMSLHSVSLLTEAILLKARSLEEMGKIKEAAKECKLILDIVDSALPNGMPEKIREDCKLEEVFHRALELLPRLWIEVGSLDEAISAYRRALAKPWNLEAERQARIQKSLSVLLLHGGIEVTIDPRLKMWGPTAPKSSTEEAILLLFILMRKILSGEIEWDPEIINHLTFALTICGEFECLADHAERVLPGTYTRTERWYFLALCYSAAGQNQTAINLLQKVSGCSEAKNKPHIPSFLLGSKLCGKDKKQAREGIKFANRVIDVAINQNEHFLSQAHKFLGICYGNAAKTSFSDSERVSFQRESLNYLNSALQVVENDPEILFSLGMENAIQRNLTSAFDNAMLYSETVAGSSGIGWKLLALILSAEQRFNDAEAVVDIALDETGRLDQLEFLRLKAILQIAQEQPKQAIETYRLLLALVQPQNELQSTTKNSQTPFESKLEVEAWQDLAKIYTDMESWANAEICLGKAKLTEVYSPRTWYTTGALFSARGQYKEALVAYSISLSLDPDFVPSLVSTAEVLIKTGGLSLPIARSYLMTALRLEPTNYNAWLNLGLISKMEGSLQQAADYFQAAHELELSAPVQGFAQL